MSGYIKYFENVEKNMSFVIEDDSVLFKYRDVWNKVKEIKGIKFHSNPVYDEKYIKAKVREFNGIFRINFLGNEVPEEGVHYTFIACINIESVVKMNKKNYPQVHLEECKYKIKKKKMPEFIGAKLELDPGSDSK